MSKSRRQFLAATSLGVLGAAAAYRSRAQNPADVPPGEPSAFGTGPAVGPEVSPATFAEAEKLVQFELTDGERSMAATSWRKTMASLYERRIGPRKLALETTVAPATQWHPHATRPETRPCARPIHPQHQPIPAPCPRMTPTSHSPPSPGSHAGSSSASSPPSASPTFI